MEGFGDRGLFVNEGDQDNVYQNLLASIDRRNLSGSSITVEVVHALSSWQKTNGETKPQQPC